MARAMADCPECGLNLALVGRNHLCRPVTNTNGTNNGTNGGTNKERDRKRRWRAAHPDRYREYQRAYMSKRRAVLAQG